MQQTPCEPPPLERLVEDAAERALAVPRRPQRIVALTPALAALVVEVGAGDRLVGAARTPADQLVLAERVAALGSPRRLEVARLVAQAPDLVLGDLRVTLRRQIDDLVAAGLPLYLTALYSLDDALAQLGEIGDLVDGDVAAVDGLRRRARGAVERARRGALSVRPRWRVFCPVRRDPWVTLGQDSLLWEILSTVGAEPLFAGDHTRPRQRVTLAAVAAARPEAILLPDGPHRFTEEDALALAPLAPTVLVDHRLLTWGGVGLLGLEGLGHLLGRLSGRSTLIEPPPTDGRGGRAAGASSWI